MPGRWRLGAYAKGLGPWAAAVVGRVPVSVAAEVPKAGGAGAQVDKSACSSSRK